MKNDNWIYISAIIILLIAFLIPWERKEPEKPDMIIEIQERKIEALNGQLRDYAYEVDRLRMAIDSISDKKNKVTIIYKKIYEKNNTLTFNQLDTKFDSVFTANNVR
jgi:hypothetical protein